MHIPGSHKIFGEFSNKFARLQQQNRKHRQQIKSHVRQVTQNTPPLHLFYHETKIKKTTVLFYFINTFLAFLRYSVYGY